jgi:hypothetical protein
VNEWCSNVDIESCDWVLQVLKLSTSPSLLVQVKQSYDYDTLPKCQQGGTMLFKLLVDKLDARTFKNTTILQDYLTGFHLDQIPGENVAIGSSCFKAAAKMMVKTDTPNNLIQHYLQGMSASGNEEFKAIC